MSQLLSNNVSSMNTVLTLEDSDGWSQILTWLSPLDPRSRHQNIQDRRVTDAGEWILRTEEFRRWSTASEQSKSDNSVLFCHGPRGVGRKFVSSSVIDSLCDQARGQDVAVTCFYFDRTAQKEQSSTNVLGALLKQVVMGLREVPREIGQAYEENKKFIGGRRLQHTDIVKILQSITSKTRTFICIDALDECMAEHRLKLLNSLDQILQKAPRTRIFLTGRPDHPSKTGRPLDKRAARLSIGLKRSTSTRCSHPRLVGDITLDTMDSLEAEIQKKLPENISQILKRKETHLEPSTDRYQLRSSLASPDIDGNPHKRQKLCTVETGSPNLDTDGVPPKGTLLNYRKILSMEDKVSTIFVLYFILQEYLRTHPVLLNAAHPTVAKSLLSNFNSQDVKAFSTSPPFPIPKTRPFSNTPSYTERFRQKGTYQIAETSWHSDCRTIIVTTIAL